MSLDPEIVAILNTTEDSFSDGGRYLSPEAAIAHALALIRGGSDILEIGPASSHPDAAAVPEEDQIKRLRPILDALADESIPISVDATNVEVLRFAIEQNVALVNDVRGFPDPSFYPELADATASLVVVHSLLGEERASRDAASVAHVLESIDRFFSKRLDELVRAGIAEDRLIIDPGMGFFLGRNPEASIAVLRELEQLGQRFGRPIFISVSRKSFLREITGRSIEESGPGTLAAELYAAVSGAAYIRTHEPQALRDVLAVHRALS